MAPNEVPTLADAYRAVGPIVQAAAKNVGSTEAWRVAEYVLSWGFMSDQLGREPSALEHQAALGVSHATYYRRRAAFRAAFPEAITPLGVEGSRALATQSVTAPLGSLGLT